MKRSPTNVTILMADDDDDDQILVREALLESQLPINLYIVSNGEELLDYLYNRGLYTDKSKAPRPGLILLDLNMPKLNGIEFLSILKNDNQLRHIPTVILTTSSNQKDLKECFKIGVSGYVLKPLKYEDYVSKIVKILEYWSANELIKY